MTELQSLTLIFAIHFVADFMLQSDWMAQGKSRRFGLNKNMAAHIVVYTMALSPLGIAWAALNGVIHFAVDAITSTATSYLWKKGNRHAFFVVIGFDQLLHALSLMWTYSWMAK